MGGAQVGPRRRRPAPYAHAMTAQETLGHLDVSREEGLSSVVAEDRIRYYGPNAIEDHPPKSAWKILGEQFRGLVVWLLVAAAVVSFVFGEIAEAAAIVVVLGLNATIGFFTEMRAVRSMEALRQMGGTTARVRRGRRLIEVPSEGLVPGDVVVVEGGDVASADLRLLSSSRLEADESALTGESLPVSKSPEPVGEDVPLAERSSMLYKGTSITRGSAEAVVVATG
ncbi:MAG TPA: cation-transporting P-type ATPase, partial [Rubrobacter sp.]|nr:cation-transporting P-type ATPase [Rubrobacter sp.]